MKLVSRKEKYLKDIPEFDPIMFLGKALKEYAKL